MKTHALILAAGRGERFGTDKMQIFIEGQRPWEIVRDRLSMVVDGITVMGVDVPGGVTRRETVLAGLATLPDEVERVIIAEGARFLVSTSQFLAILKAEADAVAYGVPLVNSVYNFHLNQPIVRHASYEIHTPQAFNHAFLRRLMNEDCENWVNDEFSLACIRYRDRCAVLPGDWRTAHKLTVRSDREVMEALHEIESR
jgi:2-C-methyl-D-erythritol 4-phosphate cytidylyltransferase